MTVIRGLSNCFFDVLTLTVAGTADNDPKSSKSPIPATTYGNKHAQMIHINQQQMTHKTTSAQTSCMASTTNILNIHYTSYVQSKQQKRLMLSIG